MVSLEQAVFTSARSDRASGYHLVGVSPGIPDADRRELCAWGPSHDSFAPAQPDAYSINFHPLPSGSYCISRTTLSGREFSGRGQRVYTHSLIASPPALACFGNNPFTLFDAVMAAQPLGVYYQVPPQLEPISLDRQSELVDQRLLTQLVEQPGPQWMGALVQAALESTCLVLTGGPPERLLAGLFSCLPVDCRTEFAFTTGLRFSLNRPFRILGYQGPAEELAALRRRYNLTVLDFSKSKPSETPNTGWGRLIERVLELGRGSFLAAQFAKQRKGPSLARLTTVAPQWLAELESVARVAATTEESADTSEVIAGKFHAAHRTTVASQRPTDTPSKHLDHESPAVLQKLELLDDAVFDAINGKTEALESLRNIWPQIRDELGPDLLAESREQYLRYAMTVWDETANPGDPRQPIRAVNAVEVLHVLLEQM